MIRGDRSKGGEAAVGWIQLNDHNGKSFLSTSPPGVPQQRVVPHTVCFCVHEFQVEKWVNSESQSLGSEGPGEPGAYVTF